MEAKASSNVPGAPASAGHAPDGAVSETTPSAPAPGDAGPAAEPVASTQADSSTPAPTSVPAPALTVEPAPQALPYAKSGSRLKALAYVSEDALQFRTFHDSELGFDCAFTADPNSAEVYCKPPKATELVFLDAECQQPAAYSYHYTPGNSAIETGEFVQAVAWGLAGSSGTHVSGGAFQVAEQVYTGGYLGSVDEDVFNSLRTLDGGLCVAARVPTSKTVPDVLRLAPIPNAKLVASGIRC